MIAHDKIPRVSPPPAVKVPTLEPSTSTFTTTSMLRSNLHEKPTHVSTLSDHYKPLQVNSARRPSFHRDPLERTEAATIDSVHIEQVGHDICESYTTPDMISNDHNMVNMPSTTFATATVTVEDFTQTSPLYQTMKKNARPISSDVHTPSTVSTTPRTHVGRPTLSSSAGKPHRDITPTRRAWNQNCPTPRAKPIMSTPQTEPRRLTRESSTEARSRPWRESITRANSTRSKLNTDIGNKLNTDIGSKRNTDIGNKLNTDIGNRINSTTSTAIPQRSRVTPSSARQTASPVGVTTSVRNVSSTTRDSTTQKDKMMLQARLDFLEKSLQDAQERAVRAEARCDELDISLQTLGQQYRDSTSRLEERNVQLHAQVQYMLQWMQGYDGKKVTRETLSKNFLEEEEKEEEPKAEEEEEEENNGLLDTSEVLRSFSTSDDILRSSRMFMSLNSEGVERREMAMRSTTVRVPPTPPMTLQLQRQ